jgi:hypothetical protein
MHIKVIHWNGGDLPEELRDLPAGTYVVQRADELTELTAEEEEGLAAALESLNAGHGVDHEDVRRRILRSARS